MIIYKSKSNSKRNNNYLPFQNLTKVSTNIFKVDINGIFDWLEMCKILFLHKSLLINQLEISSHVHRKRITQFLPYTVQWYIESQVYFS